MSDANFESRVQASIQAVPGRSLPALANTLSLAGIAWGVVALGYGLAAGDAVWTWGALLVALVWSIGLAQGGVVFAVIAHGTQARWSRPLKRIGEAFFFYLPVAWVLLAVFLLAGGLSIYAWSPSYALGEPVPLEPHMEGAWRAKPLWLTNGFFVVRLLVGLGLLFFLDYLFVRNSLGPDLLRTRSVLGAGVPSGIAWRVFGGATGDWKAAAEKGAASNYVLVPIMGFTYAIVMSMFAFDLVMSLDPWWFSNMFGGWIFMSSILLGFGAINVTQALGREWLGVSRWISTKTTHDLGKLTLAGTMFWGYTLYAQLLPIYYTDVPEETGFLLVRMMLPQWQWLTKVVVVLCFIAPFTILLSRGIKKMRYPMMGVALVSMTGLFLERTLLVMPSIHLGDAFPWGDFLFVSLGLWAGVIGLIVAIVGRVLATVPTVPVSDPLLEEHPWDVHVHAAGHAHASH